MPLIPLDEIHEPPVPVRRRGTLAQDDAGLQASIAELGLLTPIVLRRNGNGYALIAGSRRLRACRALAWTEIEAHVLNIRPDQDTLAAAAENLVRVGMDALDQWRVIVQLQSEGFSLSHAAACLGLSDRAARRLDRLGRLHPDVIALIEQHGLPDDDYVLGRIAGAPPDVQARALKAYPPRLDYIPWGSIAIACGTERIPQARAIFDLTDASVTWQEDLFAEPGDEDAIFTTDTPAFLSAQKAALSAQIKAARAKKARIEITTCDKHGQVVIPRGYAPSYGQPDKPKKTETVFCAIRERGYDIGAIVRATATKVATNDDAAEDAPDAPGETTAPGHVTDAAPKLQTETADSPRDPITIAGLELLARAKTEALVAHLADTAGDRSLQQMLALQVLALHSWTTTVATGTGFGRTNFRDLAGRLVPPEGAARLTLDDVRNVWAEAMTRALAIPGPRQNARHPDEAAEWIGQAIGADAALPRFDTKDFLQHVSAAELRRLVTEVLNDKPAKTAAGLREQLVGKLPDWRPAVFGAPGPISSREQDAA